MRNLSILDVQPLNLPPSSTPGDIAGFCVDTVNKAAYALTSESDGAALLVELRYEAGEESRVVSRLPFAFTPAVAAMHFLLERESVFIALHAGDIFTVRAGDSPEKEAELVGTVDAGVAACAWSPDDELLALVTAEARLLLMTQDFDVVAELPLAHATADAKPVALGWGRRETQYAGTSCAPVGAELAPPPPAARDDDKDDDGATRVSWRGDGAFFAVSYVGGSGEPASRRVCVFARDGRLHSEADDVAGVGAALAWRPSGRLVAAPQRRGPRHDVVFFERNGLRHGQFALRPCTRRVLHLAWNADSSVLAVTASTHHDGSDAEEVCVELWADRNYHWYLKQELRRALLLSAGGGALSRVVWDPEDPMRLNLIGTRACAAVRLHLAPDVAHVASESCGAGAVVVDAARLLHTPFRRANVPPPMALHSVDAPMPAAHVAFAASRSCHDGNAFAVLLADLATVVRYAPTDSGSGCPVELGHDLITINGGPGDGVFVARQIAWPCPNVIVALGSNSLGQQFLVSINIAASSSSLSAAASSSCIRRLADDFPHIIRLVAPAHVPATLLLAAADGTVQSAAVSDDDGSISISASPTAQFPAACVEVDAVEIVVDKYSTSTSLVAVIGRTERNQLYVNGHLLSSVCSSFYLRRDFLLFTTTTHFVHFVPIDSDLFTAVIAPDDEPSDSANNEDSNKDRKAVRRYDETRRRVERGSTIVLAPPLGDSVVFQMPRGNIETVRPRALVLAALRHALDERRYRDALMNCRVNRIDMNILYDHIPATLIADLPEFVAQVDDPDLLNLFLSGLRNEDVTRSMYTGPKQLLQQTDTPTAVVDQKTTLICRAIRPVLQATADPRFMPTILTSFMCETPPNIPAALQLLAPLSTEERDSALTYLLFLSDVDTVYNAALGLYDLPLALLVAQRSQRDPREYLPALGQLNALSSELYRRFKIDAQLGRCELAIEHLCAAYSECTVDDAAVEASRWAELAAYVVEHKLYQDALRHLTAADQHRRYSDMCLLYGDYQASMRQWKQAAASYLVGGAHSRAVDAFVQSTDWRKALALASNHASTNSLQNIHDTAIHASAVLAEHHLFGQAATVLLEYTDRDEEAIALLVKGSLWADALRYSLLRQRNDLIETTVRPGLRDAHASLLDDIDEIATAFDSKLARLREVRAIPLEALLSATFPSLSSAADADSNADGDGNLDNVDVMSDTSSMATTSRFSTFSATVTNASSSSRMTGSTARRMSKSRRKEERRKVHGKKGTIYEEAYLVDSLAKLVDRVRVHQSSAHAMNIAFIQFGWMPAASKLQSNFAKLVASVLDSAGFVFDEQRAQMQFGKNGQLEMAPPVINEQGLASQPKHPKPVLPSNDNWRIDTLV